MGGEETVQRQQVTVADPPYACAVRPLAPEDATQAARLHIAGQPGTFLTSLGQDVLSVIYSALPQTASGFGFVAFLSTDDASCRPALGFVSATTSIGDLFIQTATRHAARLLPPLLKQYARHPSLLVRSLQTGLYPMTVRGAPQDDAHASAELLSIMVDPQWRSRGIGARLLDALVGECMVRGVTALDVTVDAQNRGAQRFYAGHDFVEKKSFELYGRSMRQYNRVISP